MPSESSCREHVDKLDEKQPLKERLHNKNTFLVADESEINGSKYPNILIGDTAVPETTYVLDCSIVETVNQQVETMKIDDALKKLDIQRHNFLLLLSDAARYMTACTAALKLLYPPLFHVTCMAHLLHNCAEKVRSHFQQVDNLIAKVKVVTVKNKNWRNKFNEIGTPPQPVLTRWCTWLNAAEYYAKNLVKVREIVNAFEGDGILVSNAAKLLLMIPTLLNYLPRFTATTKCFPSWFRRLRVRSTLLKKRTLTSQLSTWKKIVWASGRTSKSACLRTVTWKTSSTWSKRIFLQRCTLNCSAASPLQLRLNGHFQMLGKLLRKDRPFSLENVEKHLCFFTATNIDCNVCQYYLLIRLSCCLFFWL